MGEWLKAGVRRKETASDQATFSPPMQQTALEVLDRQGAEPQPTWRLLTSLAFKALINSIDRFRKPPSNQLLQL